MKYSIFVASEQVLDVSAKANIQHAATKVTNMLYLPSGVRLFISLACGKSPLLMCFSIKEFG